jgi:catechol 2,3-dioxygenase-like lactoylglutathione lyase family enzyme
MIDLKFGFVVAYVDDMATAKRFYVDTLGLAVQREAPNFVQFDRFAIASDESMSGKRELEVYWLVDDAEAALEHLGKKAPIAMALRTLPFGKVFGLRDPSGQPRYVLELAKQRPSVPVGNPS